MNFWEWLSTPAGVEFTHAVIGLLVAVTGVLVYKTHENFSATNELMRRHLEEHQFERGLRDDYED